MSGDGDASNARSCRWISACRARSAAASPATDFVGIVDPVAPEADWQATSTTVPLDRYDAALVCTPDEPKIEMLRYLLGNGKHALVEKPLHAAKRRRAGTALEAHGARDRRGLLHRLQSPLRAALSCACATLIEVGRARPDLSLPDVLWQRHRAAGARLGLARRGAGVLPDLGSHLLDTARFWFGDIGEDFRLVVGAAVFENRSPDHVVFARRLRAGRSSNSR